MQVRRLSLLTLAMLLFTSGTLPQHTFAFDGDWHEIPPVKKMPLGPAPDFVRDTYLMDLQKRIRRAWFPVKGKDTLVIVVTIKIKRDGSIKDLSLTKSSGDLEADKSAEMAVKNASPFRQVGKGGPDVLVVEYTFDVKKFGDLGQAIVQ
jgi:TonB family protein